MPGLDPGIHPLRKKHLAKKMDPRVKPAGDASLICRPPPSPQPVDPPQNTLLPPHRLTYTPARLAARAASPPRARAPARNEARGMPTLNSSLPGLTRQSILFAQTSCEEDGPAGQARG